MEISSYNIHYIIYNLWILMDPFWEWQYFPPESFRESNLEDQEQFCNISPFYWLTYVNVTVVADISLFKMKVHCPDDGRKEGCHQNFWRPVQLCSVLSLFSATTFSFSDKTEILGICSIILDTVKWSPLEIIQGECNFFWLFPFFSSYHVDIVLEE